MGADLTTDAGPLWAQWQPSPAYTLGVEEEVMLVSPDDWRLAQSIEDVLPALRPSLTPYVSAETHQAAIELATDPHTTVAATIAQLRELRAALRDDLGPLGLRAAVAGTHPEAQWYETQVSPASRYQVILHTTGELARREPTFALHVHVGVPDAEAAITLMNALRRHVPLLLALSANSPYWQGRDARLASTRTHLFAAFPRTGLPRAFASYAEWASTVDELMACGAIPEPTFLWWDVRPQPSLGTVEVRVMDAQTSLERTAMLCAVVQSVARLELETGWSMDHEPPSPEVLAENRWLAARDGMDAEFIDPRAGRGVKAATVLRELVGAALPHARVVGCSRELRALRGAGAETGASRQRALAAAGGLTGTVRAMADVFDQGH